MLFVQWPLAGQKGKTQGTEHTRKNHSPTCRFRSNNSWGKASENVNRRDFYKLRLGHVHVCMWWFSMTRSSAISERPHDASCQLKSCQLLRNSAVWQVLNKSKLWSWRVKVGRCVINMCTQPWRIRVSFIVLIGVINKLTTVELCISPVYRRLAVAKFSKSTM